MWSFFSRDATKDFPYEVYGERKYIRSLSAFKLKDGRKKSTGEPVSVFCADPEVVCMETQIFVTLAKMTLKKLKTLRHPCIVTYIDSLETDRLVYLVVEPVETLKEYLAKKDKTPEQKLFSISWGLHQIASGVSFLNNDCKLCHNYVSLDSVYVNRAGEWQLFGLEASESSLDSSPSDDFLMRYVPKAVHKLFSDSNVPTWGIDSWGLGCLIWEVFNGKLENPSMLTNTKKLPPNLVPLYEELTNTGSNTRLSAAEFIQKALKGNGFFKNKFVESMLFLRDIHIKETEEKVKFFNKLPDMLDSFPNDACVYKVLPELINAFEFGNAGSSVLTPMFKLGKLLNDDEYQKTIVPCIVKMFSSKDRATRVKLLQEIEHFIDHVQPSVVNSQLFPNITQGFMDTNPAIRDHTIKCMLYIAPKLNYQNLNDEMLKHFARLQSKDEQGGIRTNTTVCLGKLASYLHPQTRKKVLIAAFLRALRDPFPPARSAAILALSATENYYSINDCATKILPALCQFTVDPEKSIREQAFKAIGGFLHKLEKVSEDPSLAAKMEEELQSTAPISIAASWTSWAVTSLADKLYKTSATSKTQKPSATNQKQSLPVSKSCVEISEKRISEKPAEESSDAGSWGDAADWNEEIKETISEDNKENDWDDDWESFETVDTSHPVKSQSDTKLSSYFSAENADPFSPTKSAKEESQNKSEATGWDVEDKWETTWDSNPIESESSSKKDAKSQQKEANRLAREQRRKQRELERQQAAPKKLGAHKIS